MAAKTNRGSDEPKYGHLIGDEDRTESVPDTISSFDSFPGGEPCEIDIGDLPDDEDEYGWTSHYEHDSRERTNPDVTQERIDSLLTTGVVWKAPGDGWDNRYLIQKEIDDYEWTLVVADDGEDARDRWVLITIYSNYHGSVGTTNKYFDRLRERRGGQ
jgi:hypothetical protein